MASIQEVSFERIDRELRDRRLREWARQLGVPGRPAVLAFEQDGYSVEAVGVAVRRVRDAPGRVFLSSGDGTIMLAWGVRIRPKRCRAFLEARFDPEGAFSFSLQDLDLRDRRGNARALAGLDLLRALTEHGGRPVECIEPILTVLRTYRGTEPPSQYEVARHVYADRTPAQARDALRKCLDREEDRNGRMWADLLRAAGWDILGR